VEQSVLEVLEASGPVPPAAAEDEAGTAAVAAGTVEVASAAAGGTGTVASRSRNHLPLLVLNLPALALSVEGRINHMVEVVEAVVHERVLKVII
jgi:hypothetical protein